MQNNKFDILIVVTPSDCERVLPLYSRLVENFDYGKLLFIGAPEVGELVKNSDISDKAGWIDENEILPFDDVHKCMAKRLEGILNGDPLPRGATGWYYQQFLKMQYSYICKDEYYMVWDGDTVPCRKINMFSLETGQPYLDMKHEYHTEYFDTMGKLLPGFHKVIERSFISEHMLFRADIMRSLIADIEKNNDIPGEKFWEKILNSIEPEKMADSSFSEFETYGTYVALRHPSVYKLREWHSFRLGASFFDMNTICARDFEWLGGDFDAISFEKGQKLEDANRGYFDNPEVQQKISAKKLLQAAQMDYKDAYKEVWEDDLTVAKGANVRTGGYHQSQGDKNKTLIVIVSESKNGNLERCIESIRQVLSPDSYKIIAIDNGLAEKTRDYVSSDQDIFYVLNEEKLDYALVSSRVVGATKGTEYGNFDVFLLSDDTHLVFDALFFLKKALYAAKDNGAVGAVSNNAGNKQQINASFDSLEEYISFGEKNNIPMESPCLERVRLSSFALLIKRQVWDEIGELGAEGASVSYDDELAIEILKRGYRLQLVRNSFIYRDTASDANGASDHQIFNMKHGFDMEKYVYADVTAISKLTYGSLDRFSLLHYGCGLGAELKAIRSLFPNSELYGIETNQKIQTITRKTEQVFSSLDEILEFIDEPFFSVLIIDKDVFDEMEDALKAMLLGLLLPNASVIIKGEVS